MGSVFRIREARFPHDLALVSRLFREYEQSLGISLGFQQFDEEIAGLPGGYVAPKGGCWLAVPAEQPEYAVGCVALRPHTQITGEVKRLYVQPAYARNGIARALMEHLITHAKQNAGYEALCLDTLKRLQPAQQLYASMGFQPIAPYNKTTLPDIVYWGLCL